MTEQMMGPTLRAKAGSTGVVVLVGRASTNSVGQGHLWASLHVLLLLGLASGGGAAPAGVARAAAVREPVKITRRGNNAAIVLAPALRRALRQRFPAYRLPAREFARQMNYDIVHGSPAAEGVRFICTGDFDGNGLPDVALYLIEAGPPRHLRHHRIPRRRWVLVAFHQTARGTFRPYILARRYDPEFWRNEYSEALNRIEDDSLGLQRRRSLLHYFTPAGVVTGPLRLRHDGILEGTDDGEVDYVYYFRRGRYHSVNIAGDES